MLIPRHLLAAIALTVVGTTLPLPAQAQRAPSGVTGSAAALQPSTRLGAGSPTGAAASLSLGVSPGTSIELGYTHFSPATTDAEAGLRRYQLGLPSVSVRTTLIDGPAQLGLLFGGGAMVYRFDAAGGTPKETTVLPTISAGAALRFRLVGPVHLDIEGRDWLSAARQGEFSASPTGKRGLAHSPEVRIGLSFLFRRRDPSMALFEDLPLSYASDFRPVDASAVLMEPNASTQGRDHVHVGPGSQSPLPPVTPAAGEAIHRPVINPAVEPLPTAGDVQVLTPAAVGPQRLGTIYFGLGSAAVSTRYRPLLSDVAKYLQQHPTVTVVITGFTDASGGRQMNLSLAEERGTAVYELLTRLYDIAPDQVGVTAAGIDYRAKEAATARRVEIVAYDDRN